MPNNTSPEQRLFEVIQKAKNPGADNQMRLDKKIKSGIFGLKNFFRHPRALFAHNPASGKGIFSLHLKLEEMGLAAANKTLSIILIFMVSSVLYYAVASKVRYYRMEKSLLNAKFRTSRNKGPIEMFKSISTYLEQVSKRDIFSPAPKSEANKATSLLAQSSEKLREIASGLKLEGISWGDEPKAMIMNTKENKMYFLSEGQPIGASGLEVMEIQKGKVVIGNGKEKIDLL